MWLWIYKDDTDHTLDQCLIFTKEDTKKERDETYEQAREAIGVSDVALVGKAKLDWKIDGSDDIYTEHEYVG